MKQLPPELTRPEDEPGYKKETWQPSWRCFCCHDSGRVVPHLARLVVPNYNYDQHKLPRCQNPGCTFGEYWDSEGLAESVDYRFTSDLCQELDLLEREDWKQFTPDSQGKVLKRIQKIAKQKNIRKCGRDRDSTEDMIAIQRHDMVVNYDWGLKAETEQDKEFLKSCRAVYEET